MHIMNMRMKNHRRHGTFAGMRAEGRILGISKEISDACVIEHAVIMSGRIHRISIYFDEVALHIDNAHL
eukprot:5189684-Heterocapsa_arctica.AAC.1